MKSEKICYYCGNKAKSKQHIPTRIFFPKGKMKNLVTVDACDKHNYEKRLLEERILYYFLGASNTELAVSYAINKALPDLNHSKKKGLRNKLINASNDANNEMLVEKGDLDDFIILLISGLYYWHFHTILNNRILYIINKIRGERIRFLKAKFKFIRKTLGEKFQHNFIGDPKVFKYKYFTDSKYSYWELTFYEKVKIIVVINMKVNYKKNI